MNGRGLEDWLERNLGVVLDAEIEVDDAGETLLRWIFGDRTGLALFLGAALFFSVYWRVGIFTTDTHAIANTMVAVSRGHLYVDQVVFGPRSGTTPGMYVADGRLYGRNYGLVFGALPVVWLLWGLTAIVDLRVALVGAWCLGLLAFAALVGERIGRRRLATSTGAVAALVLFVANVAVATPLSPRWYPVVALQVVTMGASALTAVFLYRLLRRAYGSRVGWVAGATVAVASPVGFWATFPKRHAVVALLAVLTLYCLYRSREGPTGASELRFRALAYVWVGLTAWIHSAEGLVLLIALAAVDVSTARSNRPRDLAVVFGALLISLVPFFVTNAIVAGNPLSPPRLLRPFNDVSQLGDVPTGPDVGNSGGSASANGGGTGGFAVDAQGGSDGSGGESAGGASEWGLPGVVGRVAAGLALVAADRVQLLFGYMERSVAPLLDPDRLSPVFVRSGYVEGVSRQNDRAINLSVLEAMPLLAALAVVPALAAERIHGHRSLAPWRGFRRSLGRRGDPLVVLDVFALVYIALFLLLYMDRLPLQFMLTVRYLHPIYPLGVYFLARLPPVRRAVTEDGPQVAAGYGLTVLFGVPLYVGGLAMATTILSEAVQLFAVVALAVAGLVAAWAVLTSMNDQRLKRASRLGPPLLGVAAGVTTVYLLVSGMGFFAYTQDFALPLSRVVAERLLPINPLRSLFRSAI